MKLESVSEQIENLDLDKSVKNSILALIDLKIEGDMKHFESFIKAEFEKTNLHISSETSKNSHKINLIYWMLGAFGIFISVLRFIG